MQDRPSTDPEGALDAAFKALRAYGVGSGRAALMPLDAAVAAAGRQPTERASLEARFIEVLSVQPPVSALAREYVCRQLARIGAEPSAKALAGFLEDKECAEAARCALESIPGEGASTVLRERLSRATGVQKAGIAQSLGARRDRGSVATLAALLNDGDHQVAAAAASALGWIGTLEAAKTLNERAARNDGSLAADLADARLSCAEALLADGRKADALAIYKSLTDASHPPQVQLAAKRGLLVAMQRK